MNKTYWYLEQPVEKYEVFEDKDLEDINFHGGVICFRSYLEKMIQNKHQTPNSTISIDSITWQSGRDVLYVKYTQLYSFDYLPLKKAVDDYLKEKGIDDYSFSCLYNNILKQHSLRVEIETTNSDSAKEIMGKVSNLELKAILNSIEPDFRVGVDILVDIKPGRTR